MVELVQRERKLQPRIGTRKLQGMMRKELEEAGVKIGRDRLFTVLRQRELLVPPLQAEFPRTTNSYHCLPVFANRIKDLEVTKPNEVWVGDLTYLRTQEGYLYLALLTDKMSRNSKAMLRRQRPNVNRTDNDVRRSPFYGIDRPYTLDPCSLQF